MEGQQCYRTPGLATAHLPAGVQGSCCFSFLFRVCLKHFPVGRARGGAAESCTPVARWFRFRPGVLVCLNLRQAERLQEHGVEVLRFQFPLELTPAHPGKRCQGPGHQL